MESAVGRAKAARRQANGPVTDKRTIKSAVVECLPEAIAKASEDGANIYYQRSLFYVVRDFVKARHADMDELKWKYFCDIITEHEDAIGHDLEGMHRDNRGTIRHPHTGEEIPLGTGTANRYRRPDWTFNKILYSEKEGLFAILSQAKWSERNDCALMTSKGFASRAARDVLDLLGRTEEPLKFYCIHDADAYGTMIQQALQEGTKARDGRDFKVINLGMEAHEALAMGLEAEPVERDRDRRAPVARYVAEEHGPEWVDWYQSKRIELNAMTSPQFLEWHDRKFAAYSGKVIPPADVVADRLEREGRERIVSEITEQVLREARVNEQAAAAWAALDNDYRTRLDGIRDEIWRSLQDNPAEPWTVPVGRIAAEIVEGAA